MTQINSKRGKWVEVMLKIGCLPFAISFFFLSWCILNINTIGHKLAKGNIVLLSCIFIAGIFIIIEILLFKFTFIADKFRRDLNEEENKRETMVRDYKKKIIEINNVHNKDIEHHLSINNNLVQLLQTKEPFSKLACMVADFKTCIFKKDEEYLRYKPKPAKSAADHVKHINSIMREKSAELYEMKYKYAFLLSVFPELREYVDDESSLLHLSNYGNIQVVKENYDRVRDWINDTDYYSMSEDERNQLALNRYKKRPKSNWEIGIEYELYIGYLLREGKFPFSSRFHVTQFGELKGLSDLGRDIIAEKIEQNGMRTIYIIQCKRWAEDKIVHENAICQIYGTTIEYKIRNQIEANSLVVPVFISTTNISEMAKDFAKQLGVLVYTIPMDEYPMIKCNINRGERIYHLPFDQQYHRTEIKNTGEFYAMTVKEATQKGFRRAVRHLS